MVRGARVGALVVVSGVLVWACGGGIPFKEGGQKAASELKGIVVKAPVANATVTAYAADAALARGEVLAQGKADEGGNFDLSLPPYQGHVLLVATGGSYVEEAIGLGVQLGDNELQLLVPNFTTGSKPEGLKLTPISTLAVALARFHVAAGESVADAHAEALQHLRQHFGGVDWMAVLPADLTDAGVTVLSLETKAGLVLSGLSWLAKQQSEASDVTPGLVINAATLTTALVKDAADGTLDGRAGADAIRLGKVTLTGAALRSDLVQGITGFVNSRRNASALKLQDITAFLALVGTDSDPYLFCPGQMAGPSCASGPVDTEPPVIAFTKPSNGAGVAGSVAVEVKASDNTKLKTLHFTAPASLVAVAPVFANQDREGTLSATLDVSALPDGPVEVRAEVIDSSGNPAAKSITVVVSNQGPRISIGSPGAGAVVKGSTVVVAATATAQAPGATIAKIELVNPPPGLGPDTVPASDSFSAVWNTSAAAEGAVTLTLKATDSFNTSTEATVTVTVDNVPFGRVSVAVSAGAPVDGLAVKLVAIDETTGLPVTGRLGGPVLGEATAVTVDGGVSFELVQENYTGPVQLVASGPTATYIDPTDGVTQIALPSTFEMSSYVDSYSTGDRLERPVTFVTTLADEAARAYALGKNPAQPGSVLLPAALRAVDPLFARHITSSNWNARTTMPVRLTTIPQSIRDVVYAAFSDVALNQLARDIATDVGLTPGTGFAAPQLVELLRSDLSDGRFDGMQSSVQLVTGGTTPYSLDANTTRFKLAIGLDRFIRGAQNRTGLGRQDLQSQAIYDTMSNDTSILYASNQTPVPFDNMPPAVTWTVSFTNGGSKTPLVTLGTTKLAAGVITVQADATDPSGAASITMDADGVPLSPSMGSTATRFVAQYPTATLPDGTITFTALACDRLSNCAPVTFAVDSDNTLPSISQVKPLPGYYSAPFDFEALAQDNQKVASFTISGITTLVDQDNSIQRVYAPAASWTIPAGTADGPLPLVTKACDVVRNCATLTPPVLDRTPPAVAITTTVPASTNQPGFSLSGTVADPGAGVARVLVSLNGGTPVDAMLGAGSWTASVTLAAGSNTITVWAEDLAVPKNSGQGKAAPASASATIALDTTPPTVAWTLGYTNGTASNLPPEMPGSFVAGTLSIRAVASDPAGVTSLALVANGSALTADPGSSASTFIATVNTTSMADGTLTLVATACDALGNCGPVTNLLGVDNTKPSMTQVKPQAGYYSAPFDFEALAVDGQKLASFTVSGIPSLVDQDTAVQRIYAPASSWTLPAGLADGSLPLVTRACDQVHNCATLPPPLLDRTPPSVAITSSPPSSTNQPGLAVKGTVADASAGVSRVLVSLNGASPSEAVVTAGTWTASLTLAQGSNTIVVWAEDASIPRNSGQGAPAPASATATVLLDTTPPTIAWSLGYTNGGVTSPAPEQPGSLIAGTLAVRAQASDPSGVASVSVTANGGVLPLGVGTTASVFLSSVETTLLPDGSLALVATACDTLGNCGPSTSQLNIDNTKPSVSALRPLPAYYSQAFDIEGLASDNSRLLSFVIDSTVSSIVDQDMALNRVYVPATFWVLDSHQVNAQLPLLFTACDVVHNCNSAMLRPVIDTLPPTVSVTSAVPQYTNQTTLPLTVSVVDGSGAGVTKVFAQAGAEAAQQGVLNGGTWSFPTLRLKSGLLNNVQVWAEDAALPSNSGFGRSPYAVSFTVLVESLPPILVGVLEPAYFGEAGLDFVRNTDTTPVMPVQWKYAGAAKEDLSVANTSITKAATRLSWGPTKPTGAELEGANSRNVPFYQFSVPYNSTTDSPILSVQFRFRASHCVSCASTQTTAWVDAIPAARSAPGLLYFDIPIAVETLPQMKEPSGGWIWADLDVQTLDAAGNVGYAQTVSGDGTTALYLRQVYVATPPVSLVLDSNYVGRGDPKSPYAYRISNSTYGGLFDPNNANFLTDNNVRLSRWVVYNPSDSNVALTVAADAPHSYQVAINENWNNANYVIPVTPGVTYNVDGFTFRTDPQWDSRVNSGFYSGCRNDALFVPPCGYNSINTRYPMHVVGDPSQYSCADAPLPASVPNRAASMPAAGTYRVFRDAVLGPTGSESTAAASAIGIGGAFLVPPASGGKAGTVAVYLVNPRTTARGSFPLQYSANQFDPAVRYQIWYADLFVPTQQDGEMCMGGTRGGHPELATELYAPRRWYRQLADATTQSPGVGIRIRTAGADASGQVVGAPLDYATSWAPISFAH